ncbi:MAG: hypothetical protein JWP10_240 [Nocardioidaceae bacterium]|nr:hypothetical protein [Nocardioidaceae bacterium]
MEISSALVIIGSGPAGLSAARGYRDAGGGGRVLVVTADEHAPYERPPLSKEFLRGETSAGDVAIEDDAFFRDAQIELMLSTTVDAIDLAGRSVSTRDGDAILWTSLVLAMGNEAVRLDVPGGDHERVRVLRSLSDAQTLVRAAEDARSVIVIGSGFIGCEAAASLASRGLVVTVVSPEESPQITRLGAFAARRIRGWLEDLGVRVLGGTSVKEIREGRPVHLDDGTILEADLVVAAVGAKPRTALAADAGLVVEEDRVRVDAHMKTSAPGVYAAGDVAYADNGALGHPLVVEHWGDALAMGEVAGSMAAGVDATWDVVPGFWSDIGDKALQYASWGEGFEFVRVVEHDATAFTAWYESGGRCVGVLTHDADDDYERGITLIRAAATDQR